MATEISDSGNASASGRVGKVRWVIVGLLFAATAINYIDRQTIALLKPTLQKEFSWTETTYSDIVIWFQVAYALGYIVFGNFVDRVGARIGYAAAFTLWTIAHILHAAAHSVFGFSAVRFLLGIGESGNFPAGLKAVTEWFPKKERALATGIFNAGSNIGAIVAPWIVPAITLAYGWRSAFVITGLGSLLWLVAWIAVYRRPRESKRLSAAELAYIEQDAADPAAKVPWSRLIGRRETWAFAVGKFLTDPVWWMFLFWLPDFLVKRHGLDLKTFGPPLIVIYILSDLGSIAGGWLSSTLIHRGWTINRARKTTMLICALAVTPIVFAQYVDSLWAAVGIIGLAAAAHQAWSANLYTLPSDVFPRKAVGSVIGIGGTAGAVGGIFFSAYIGQVLERVGTYGLIFYVAGSVYLIALAIIHWLTPRLEVVEVADAATRDVPLAFHFYLFAIPAVVLLGLSKGGFTGLGALATPLIALGIDPIRGAAILLPILIAQDVVSVAAFRRHWDGHVLAVMLPGAVVGVVIAYIFAASVPEAAVMAVLGAVSILFGAYRLWAERGHQLAASSRSPGWVGSLFGVATGFTSQIAHAGGPPFQMWVMPRRLPRDVFVGTTALFFAALNLIKVPAYVALGQFSRDNLMTALFLLPVAVASSFAGVKLVRHVPVERFYTIVYWLMIVAGGKLLLDGLGIV